MKRLRDIFRFGSNANSQPAPEEKTICGKLPLEKMHYQGRIEGLQADLTLDLQYANKLEKPVEAIFTFPLPSQALVLGVEMKIGERIVEAELKKRAQAEREYDSAVADGHSAALAEQERSDIFTMSVGGIQPGEQASVKIKYQQPVDWQNSGGRFRLPLVVAPAFIPGAPVNVRDRRGWSPDTDAVPDASRLTPRLADQVNYSASMDIKLTPGFAAKIACPSHPLLLGSQELDAGGSAELHLENVRADRDVVVTYQTESRVPTLKVDRSAWTNSCSQREEYMLLQLAPALEQKPRPRDVIFCLDCSGSMEGAGIEGLKRVMEKTIDQLIEDSKKTEVRVGIVKFSNNATRLANLSPVSEKHKQTLEQLEADGGTEAGPALDYCMKQFPAEDEGRERCIVFLSDGQTYSRHFKAQPGVRIYSVGIGAAIGNEFLTDVARRTDGLPYWVRSGEDYDTVARELTARTSGPEIRALAVRGLGDTEVVGLQSLFADYPATMAIKLPKGHDKPFQICGTDRSGQEQVWTIDPAEHQANGDLARKMWARMMLREDLSPDKAADISLQHGILSQYTAFVSVMTREVPGRKPERIDIPVLLPEGWDYEMMNGRRALAMDSVKGIYALGAMDVELCCCMDSFECDDIVVEPDPHAREIPPLPPIDDEEPELVEKQLLADARALVEHLHRYGTDYEAQRQWQALQADLQEVVAAGFNDWSETERAELLLTLVQCSKHGLTVQIPELLRERPADPGALSYWGQAQRDMGMNISF